MVGGFNPSEKYESQLGLLFPIYGKIIQMFQTNNQIYIYIYIHHSIYPYNKTSFLGAAWQGLILSAEKQVGQLGRRNES